MACGPGGRALDDAAVVAPCADFDLVLPATGNVGGGATGFVWTGSEYLVLWNSNAMLASDSTLAAIDPSGAVRWTHEIHGGATGLAWDGHHALVAAADATELTFTSIDPTTQLDTVVFQTPASGSGGVPMVAGTDGRFGITWVDMAGTHYCELVEGQAGPIATGVTPVSFIATPMGYAASVRAPTPAVVLFDREFTATSFPLPSTADLDGYGPMLAATDVDVVAVQTTRTPEIVVDFVSAGRRVELPLQFASGLLDAAASAAFDRGTVYVAANEFGASARYVGTIVLGDDGGGVSQVMLSDSLLTGTPMIVKDVDRTAIIIGHATEKPSFTLSQRCAPP